MDLTQYSIINKVYHSRQHTPSAAFEQQYLAVRDAEQRIYTDETLAGLPVVNAAHPLYKEWRIRETSALQLLQYCRKHKAQRILEIGCGNGWLSNQLAGIPGSTVVGTDINLPELEQAARVFQKDNLFFIYDVFSNRFMAGQRFDVIVFAASIQYFSPLLPILQTAISKLAPGGTVHLADTCFYTSAAQKNAARERTHQYYTQLGFPEMADNYFHHTLADLQPLQHTLAYNPHSLRNRLLRKKHPFHWVVLHQQ